MVAKKKFKPSVEQNNIFTFIEEGEGNLVVSACAGSGKTTTIVEAVERIPKDKTILFMAFNTSIMKELSERIKPRAGLIVTTVHGYGNMILSDTIRPNIDKGKYRSLFYSITDYAIKKSNVRIKEYGFDKKQDTWIKAIVKVFEKNSDDDLDLKSYTKNILELCNLSRLDMVDLLNKVNGFSEIKKTAKHYGISIKNNEHEVAWYLINLGYSYTKTIDFTDMISLPIHLGLETKKFDFVFIDECQDINQSQRLLMTKSIKEVVGRSIAVGDPKQAIYSFCGADWRSYQKLIELPNTQEMTLSVSYRCHKQLVDRVKIYNPLMKHLEGNEQGEFISDFSYHNLKDGDMVLCRNSFPVVSLCIRLLSEGKKSFIIGSDIGKTLIYLLQGAKQERVEYTMENVLARLFHDKDKMVQKTMEEQKITKDDAEEDEFVNLFYEKIQVISSIAGNETDPLKVIEKINKIFSDTEKKGISLSTIHKSKGLEADRVFLLNPELIPSKYAVKDWQLQQEDNLTYVAETRAKTVYGYITDFDAYGSYVEKRDPNVKVKESKWVGKVDDRMGLELEIVNIQPRDTTFGPSFIVTLEDKKGNEFSRWGDIHPKYLKSGGDKMEVGDWVKFYSIIKNHREWNGRKITDLGRLSKH